MTDEAANSKSNESGNKELLQILKDLKSQSEVED
jgi:hypothetical protein